MKNMMLSILMMTAGLFSANAFASQASCDLSFNVRTDTFILVSTGGGHGVVVCYDEFETVTSQADVNIHITGFGPGIGSFHVRGDSYLIPITSPEQIEGTYFVGQGGIGAGEAVGDVMGFKSEQSELAFQADMGMVRGGGLFLNATRWTITLAR